MLRLFVDDIILFTDDRKLANVLINTLRSRFDTKAVNECNDPVTNNYDILGLEIQYQKGESMSFGMGKSIEEKLPKFNINLDMKKNVPGVFGLIPKKEELIVTEKEYKQKVKWMQMVIELASYIGYKYRFDLLYYINVSGRYTLYPSATVIGMINLIAKSLRNSGVRC